MRRTMIIVLYFLEAVLTNNCPTFEEVFLIFPPFSIFTFENETHLRFLTSKNKTIVSAIFSIEYRSEDRIDFEGNIIRR